VKSCCESPTECSDSPTKCCKPPETSSDCCNPKTSCSDQVATEPIQACCSPAGSQGVTCRDKKVLEIHIGDFCDQGEYVGGSSYRDSFFSSHGNDLYWL
jgi:hypothetical protein